MTTHPKLANFAKYPAVNWFSFYILSRFLTSHGFQCLDRFDVVDLSKKRSPARIIIFAVRTLPVLRWLAHVATQGTTVVAIKKKGARE
jgi:2-polyprenyl-6-hydroxyphenyl methylase/3-demethylubiquinone-9 3-methyltransferase